MKSHIEKSRKYELDQYLIKKIYNKQEKKKRLYNVTKKNVVYDKQLTEQYFKYSNNNRNNYYSSYQSFRDYISSGYNYDFLVNEISNVKSILGFSKNIREIINKKITNELSSSASQSNHSNSYQNKNQIIEMNESSSNENPKMKQNLIKNTKNQILRRTSAVFHIDQNNVHIKKIAELAHRNVPMSGNYPMNSNVKKDFLEICKLLKTKEEELNNPQNQYQFRLFSVMSEDFDPFYLPVYENFMNVKYENQKTKLIKLYNQENAFIKCVTLIQDKLKSHLNQKPNTVEDNNMQDQNGNQVPNFLRFNKNTDIGFHTFHQHKLQIKIPYINAFYLGRTEIYFKDIDNFMSIFKENTSLSTKKLEKDFFENLFKILTYNNADCKKFLQYLYSHSYFFKYIYNYFTFSDKNAGISIRKIAPSIKKNKEEAPFLDDSLLKNYFSEEPRNKEEETEKIVITPIKEDDLQNNNNVDIGNYIDILLGNDFIFSIGFCSDDIVDIVNNKKIGEFKEIILDDDKFNNDYVMTVNNSNNENLLQIINFKAKQRTQKKKNANLTIKKFEFSLPFDNRIVFFDLKRDFIRNLKIERQKNENYLLLCLKNDNQDGEYSQAYVFKVTDEIYSRFQNSASLKNKLVKNEELFGEKDEEEEEDEEDEKINFKYHKDRKDELGAKSQEKEVKSSQEKDKEKSDSEEEEEEENRNKKKRNEKRKFTFGVGTNIKNDNESDNINNE